MLASRWGHKEVVNLGAQINLQENEGKTALFVACEEEHIEVVELLLKKHPQVDLQDYKGRSPLQIASQQDFCRSSQAFT